MSSSEATLCPRCHLPALPEPARLYQQPSPFTQYLGTPLSKNESVSPSDVASLEPYIEALESDVATLGSEISTLKAALQRLEHQLDEASSHLHLHKGLLCRIHDLPNEILCQIFLYCLDDTDHRGSYDLSARRSIDTKGRRAPWELTSVCHRWREVGTHLPQLWSAPSFVIGNQDEMCFNDDYWESNCLSTALSRTGEALLTLDIDLDSQYAFNWLSGLESIFPRVETLYLTGLPVRFSHDGNSADNAFPNLRKLGVTAKFDALDLERQPDGIPTLDWNMMLSIIRSSAPPHELTLTHDFGDCHIPREDIFLNPSALPFSLGELTKLTLRAGCLIAMAPLLRACPFLSTLSLFNVDLHGGMPLPDDNMITLPSLQSLNLSGSDIYNVLWHLQCPQLRHLTATSSHSLSPFDLQGIVSRSQCVLQTLDIHIPYYPWDLDKRGRSSHEEIWRNILPLLSCLETLTLRLGRGYITSILPQLTKPHAFPLLSSLIARFDENAFSNVLWPGAEATTRDDAENALERFFSACIYKADGGVLSTLDVQFGYSLYVQDQDQNDINLLRQNSRLLVQMHRWKGEGVHIRASHVKPTHGFHYSNEDLV